MNHTKNKITEEMIATFLDESVNDVIARLGEINEMAVPLKTYKERVDGLRFVLVENWCLCMWCRLFNTECDIFSHWIKELKACINNLKQIDIKNDIDKKRVLSRMLVEDYDYDDMNMIMRIIRDKFDKEKIFDKGQREAVSSEFADNIKGLIEVISSKNLSTNEYIQKVFKG